jgi:hypothetical protein
MCSRSLLLSSLPRCCAGQAGSASLWQTLAAPAALSRSSYAPALSAVICFDHCLFLSPQVCVVLQRFRVFRYPVSCCRVSRRAVLRVVVECGSVAAPPWRSILLPSLERRRIVSTVRFISRSVFVVMATAARAFTTGRRLVRLCCWPTCISHRTRDFTAAWISTVTSSSRIPENFRSTSRCEYFSVCSHSSWCFLS